MLKWDHWHIEPSSICTLKCPRCTRAEVPESLLNRQLTLDFFKNQIGIDTIKQIRKITFCGNDGDPIYCRDFLEICHWIKQANPTMNIVMITNGSYKFPQWWQELGKVFNQYDEVHWSIDGWDQVSNEQYRVNSDWDSIVSGIQNFSEVNKTTYKVWASIGFRFNESNIDKIKNFASQLKFDQFQLTKSTKFGSRYPQAYPNDNLEPTNQNLVSSSHRFEREVEFLTNRCRPGQDLKILFANRAEKLKKLNVSGICLIGNKGVFLNSRGEFYPCCWVANRYPHNSSWNAKAASSFNLNTKTFSEIISDPFWTTDFLKFNSLECQTKCTAEKLNDIKHTTEW